eukprot:4092514-Pyramimonas_sp.AAC.1
MAPSLARVACQGRRERRRSGGPSADPRNARGDPKSSMYAICLARSPSPSGERDGPADDRLRRLLQDV